MAVTSLNLIVCGVGGRMGGAVVRSIQESRGAKLVGAIDRAGSRRIGKDAGEIAGAGTSGIEIGDRFAPRYGANTAIIDFTNPNASVAFLRSAAKKKIPIVIGTTGFDTKQLDEIKELAQGTPTLVL
jgi:4-hydroxy-tetrahydrodipicolinate reductase